MLNPNLIVLLNHTDGADRVMAHMVPTRILRITNVRNEDMTFRVEQLTLTSRPHAPEPRGTWRTLSTHGGQRPGEGLAPAFADAVNTQKKLVSQLQSRLGILKQ